MASAKFLEEALSTDVDESAVNAIVGSLETQLVTTSPAVPSLQVHSSAISQQNHQANSGISNGGTIPAVQPQKHGVANGGGTTTINSVMTQEAQVTKTIASSNLLPVNVVTCNSVAPQVTTHHQQQPQQPHSQLHQHLTQTTFMNQVTSNQTNASTLAKPQSEHLKIIYASPGQVLAATGGVAQLANGSLGVVTNTTQAVLQTTSNAVNVGSAIQNPNQPTLNVNKPPGTAALVIKTSSAHGGMVSVPMSVPVSVASTTLQGKAGVTSTTVPSSVQILNVNAMRPGTPVSGQQPGKQVPSRVVIGQGVHMVGARPGASGITLQALHGLQPGTQGHLLLKTENGQFQLLRVGPVPTAGSPAGAAVSQNSIGGNAVVAAPTGNTTYRLASVPGVSRLNAQFTGPPLTTIRKPLQTAAANVATTTTITPTPSPVAVTTATTSSVSTIATAAAIKKAQSTAQRQPSDNTKEKCRKFLANLLELSSREPKSVERNVRTLMQELIDATVEPEEFCDRLEKLLNATPQPCLITFLKKSLPLLRQSLVTTETTIDGIRPPPPNVAFSIATPMVTQNQVRPAVAVASSTAVVTTSPAVTATPVIVPTAPTAGTQVRVMAPLSSVSAPVQRPPQPLVQQRLIRPGATVLRSPSTFTVKTTVAGNAVRPAVPVVQKAPITTVVKAVTSAAQGKTTNMTTPANKAVVPSSMLPKTTAKEKEKKTFSSTGYTGDDDINDVAAMGGVNLAEESQRILGSTEFVGTQIRSCKDEIFLHLTPLQQRIKKIVSSYGLEEPNQEVASLISHAAQERLKTLVERLAVIAEHRIDVAKVDPRYEVTQDVRSQLKFMEELDRAERKRHEEHERELLLRAAKSRAKTEDPEQAKLKAKAKEMQRAEMEELRQREANLTALQAIGPRKKPKLDLGNQSNVSGSSASTNAASSGTNRQIAMRPRLKRVNFRDLLFLLEQEKETCRSTTLYKAYLK